MCLSRVKLGLWFVFFAAFFSSDPLHAQEMFFEEREALTVLSRKSEDPVALPASVFVITSEDLSKKGFLTLSEALSSVPGFYMGRVWWGSRPYVRGIPEGALVLYDGVPLTSDSTKTLNLLDEEISLEALERIEVVLGPGSVLWGPDAFAGVVNLVPKRARRHHLGLKTFAGTPFNERKVLVDLSHNSRFWQTYLALGWWQKDFERVREHTLSEAVFNLEVWPGLRISGRFSGGERSFRGRDDYYGISWPGSRSFPVNFLKGEFRRSTGPWAFLLKAYWERIHARRKDLDFVISQKNRILALEGIVSRELFGGEGLVNIGFGYRKNRVQEATIEVRGLLSEYLVELPFFRPLVDREDFDTELYSVFLQVRRRWGGLEFFAGLRLDDHSEYRPGLSFSTGVVYDPRPPWSLRLIYGSAYRTPYSAEFLQRDPSPERLYTLSLEWLFAPRKDLTLRLTPFYSYLKRLVVEDPLGGFSQPLSQRFLGLEAYFNWKPCPRFDFSLSLSAVNSWGEREHFRVLEYMVYLPDEGSWEAVYTDYFRPYDRGASFVANLETTFEVFRNFDVFMRLKLLSKRTFKDLRLNVERKLASAAVVDLALRWRMGDKRRLLLMVKDLFDRAPEHPSYLTVVPEEGFRAYVGLELEF